MYTADNELNGQVVDFTDFSGSNFRVYIFLQIGSSRNPPAVYPNVANATTVNIGAPASGGESVDVSSLIPLVSLRLAPSVDNNLIGAVGDQAAALIMTHVKMSDQLPSLESIKNDPKNAIVPTSVAAVCMVVYRTLSLMEKDWIKPWMEYMQRLDTEAQAMFANGVRSEKYSKRSMLMGSAEFRDWAMKHQHLYTADV